MECVRADLCERRHYLPAGEICNQQTGEWSPQPTVRPMQIVVRMKFVIRQRDNAKPRVLELLAHCGLGEACASPIGGGAGGNTCAEGLTCGLLSGVCEELAIHRAPVLLVVLFRAVTFANKVCWLTFAFNSAH